jgi:REase_DpnII-MboI
MTSDLKPHKLLHSVAEQVSSGWDSVSKLQELSHYLTSTNNFASEEHDLKLLEFNSQIQGLYVSISALIEAIGMPDLCMQFRKDYAAIPQERLAALDFIPLVGELHSNTLGLFWRYHTTLSSLLGEDINQQIEEDRRNQFEGILRNTPKIVKDRGIEPSNEADVRRCVYDLLIHIFPDVVREASIIQGTKTYKPDLGIKSLKTAAEYKFADSAEEVKKAIGGLYEDMRGYAGSEDWKYFFAVVYMTDAFFTPQQIMAEFKHTKADANWKPILVIGKGARKKKGTSA